MPRTEECGYFWSQTKCFERHSAVIGTWQARRTLGPHTDNESFTASLVILAVHQSHSAGTSM